jgi:hypothetical protein
MLKLVVNPARQERVVNPVFSGAGFLGFQDWRMNTKGHTIFLGIDLVIWVFLGKIRNDNRRGILAVFSGGTSGLF